MYLRVTLDLPISYEEASFIKETFVNEYDCREITLIPSQQDEEINTDIDITQFESVDQIVTKEITAIDTENYDKNLLLRNLPTTFNKTFLLTIDLFSYLWEIFLVIFIFVSSLAALILMAGSFYRLFKVFKRKSKLIIYK